MDITIDILKNYDLDKIKEHFQNSYDKIITYPKHKISEFIKLYYTNIHNNVLLNLNNYKNKNFYYHYEVIYKYLPYVNKNIKLKLIEFISNCMHGQCILEKIPDIMNMLSIDEINTIIKLFSHSWTYPVFVYYFKLMNKCNIKYPNEFIINNYCNSDDRIYKYIVNHNELKLICNNEIIILEIILNLFNENIPNKYILRRIKHLNQIIPDFKKYSYNILLNSIKPTRIMILPTLLKYYSTLFSSNNIYDIVTSMFNSKNLINIKEYYMTLYELFSTITEKNTFVICALFKLGTSYGKTIINGYNDFINLKTIIKIHLSNFNNNIYNFKNINTDEFKKIIDMIGFHNMSSCYYLYESTSIFEPMSVYYMMPFLVAYGYNSEYYNKLRYNFIKYIKNIRRKKISIIKLKLYPIINELKTKQLCNKKPPYHLYPGQLQNFKNMEFLLKEKADGILVNTLPINNIFPNYKIMDNIKAEYIEDLDLYLVFDLDDNSNPLDNHMIIHNNHPYGQNTVPIINNVEEFIKELNKERTKLKEFLAISYNNYRWYPKPAWKIVNIEPFIELLIDIINMKNNNLTSLIINDSIINLDGLILTPLDLSREIKIKPKNLYSIDLLYKNNNWIDQDGYKWNLNINININNHNQLKENQIWRLYPNHNPNYNYNYWEAREIRNDKIKPNPHSVVVTIIDLYNLEYNYYYKNIYHEITNTNYMWKNISNDNNKIIKLMLNNINNINNILDCGCGSGRIIKYLNKFNKYVGIDLDLDMIGKAININNNNNNNNNNYYFMYCDLNSTNYPHILNDKFNTITCINSIMYFMNDNFWTLINNITTPSAIMIVNIVDKIVCNDYYMEIKNNKLYYKFPIHNTIREEPYITYDYFKEICLKYGWNITLKYKSNNNNITDNYQWYLLKR